MRHPATLKTMPIPANYYYQLGTTGMILCPHRSNNPHRIRTRDLLITSHTPYVCHHRVRTKIDMEQVYMDAFHQMFISKWRIPCARSTYQNELKDLYHHKAPPTMGQIRVADNGTWHHFHMAAQYNVSDDCQVCRHNVCDISFGALCVVVRLSLSRTRLREKTDDADEWTIPLITHSSLSWRIASSNTYQWARHIVTVGNEIFFGNEIKTMKLKKKKNWELGGSST